MLAALETRVNRLAARTQLLEIRQPEQVAAAAALALAVGQLRAVALSGRPFTAALGGVTSLLMAEDESPGDVSRALQILEAQTQAGVVTLAELRRRFAGSVGDVLRAETLEAESWIDQTLHRLAAVVTVRRTGEVTGAGTEAILARSEARLDGGDLLAAVAEFSTLTGAAADVAAPWLDLARTRIAVEAALAGLEAYAVSRVATIDEAARHEGIAR